MALPTTQGDPQHERWSPQAGTQVTELLGVLDEDIRHVEATLLRLDALRTLLIRRDDKALEGLLEDIRREQEAYAATEQKRQELRRDLAADLGWKESDLTLSRLAAQLTGPGRTALSERQKRLKVLTAQLKREHALTILLISDCARFNRSLLRAFFGPAAKEGTMYSSTGTARHPTGMALLNMQF